MSRNHEARLAKLEQGRQGRQRTHEEWLDILDSKPPLTEAESAAIDAAIEAEAIDEFGSLVAAAEAARVKAKRTGDPFDSFLATDLKIRAQDLEPVHALA